MPTPESTTPEDFDPIFSQGVVIVGGHAVNLWASYYAVRGDSVLAQFAPFTSKDADIFLRDPSLAQAIAAAAGWEFRGNREPRSPVLGILVMQRNNVSLQVDVMRSVTGLTHDDLAATESITFENGKSYSVPAPDVMLKAKLANLRQHNQANRQDERHVRILLRCCRHYLEDVCAAVTAGELPEREAIERFMIVWRLISAPEAKVLDQQYGLELHTAVPIKEALGDLSSLPRVRAFYQHQVTNAGSR
ncbi:MAG: hypothetical protein QM715_20925 [Nibricoccus sp.]